MARKPLDVTWGPAFSEEQRELLDFVDFVGDNAWSENGQTETVMPALLADCASAGLTLEQITAAMRDIGYSREAVHQIERWESKRTTRQFGT